MAHLLLDLGADPNYEGPDGTPLVLAIRAGNAALVKLLLEKGADANKLSSRRPTREEIEYALSRDLLQLTDQCEQLSGNRQLD